MNFWGNEPKIEELRGGFAWDTQSSTWKKNRSDFLSNFAWESKTFSADLSSYQYMKLDAFAGQIQ